MPAWQEFDHTARNARRQSEAPPKEEDAADVCARLLITSDGREFLRHLYILFVDKRVRAHASEAELREAEAKRNLVYELERLRDLGLERAVASAKN